MPADTQPTAPTITQALEDFVRTIENTGGVVKYRNGSIAPQGDPTWTDLGDSYMQACRALGRTPVLTESPHRDADAAGAHLYQG